MWHTLVVQLVGIVVLPIIAFAADLGWTDSGRFKCIWYQRIHLTENDVVYFEANSPAQGKAILKNELKHQEFCRQ